MNEQLQESLAVVLEKAVAGVEQGVDFLSAELPDVIHQLLVWKAAVSGLSMLAFFALVYVIYRINKMQVRHWKKVMEEDAFFDHPEMILNMFQVFWGIPLIALWSIDWLHIWLAPKIYLIEYAASLAK